MHPLLQAFVDSDFVQYVDNGRAPRTLHDYGYERKIGAVDHIPVAGSLDVLTRYFNGGQAQGSTHFGIGREQAGVLEWGGVRIPVARVDQYMPIRRNASYPDGCSPWAQGVIARPSARLVRSMRPGEPNGAFHSFENVAWSGQDGLTVPQFNARCLLGAYCAELDGYPIDPVHTLGHFEIDGVNRANDPGWPGETYDAIQSASNRLRTGDPGGLRDVQRSEGTPTVTASEPWRDIVDGYDRGQARRLQEAAERLRDEAQQLEHQAYLARQAALEQLQYALVRAQEFEGRAYQQRQEARVIDEELHRYNGGDGVLQRSA